jgi:hypothetical protein
MTGTLLDYDPNDTGDIPTGDIPRQIGEERIVIRRDTTGEDTRNLSHEIAGLPPRRRPAADETARMRLIEPALGLNHHDMSRVIEIDDTVTYMPATIGLAGPQDPPPPLPPAPRPSVPPQYDMAAAQPLWPLERVAGAAETQTQTILHSLTATVDGELAPAGYLGRHRDPQDRIAIQGEAAWGRLVEAAKPGGEPHRLRVQVGVGAFIAFAAAVTVAVLVVFW